MPDLDSYFSNGEGKRDSHPLIRLLDTQQKKPEFSTAKVQIIRPRAALGFEPARLSLQFFDKKGEMYAYKVEPWDAELNNALVVQKICAIDRDNEIQRFGLSLGSALEHAETRYGDGFFSAILMLVVDQSPFAGMEQVQKLRPYIATNRPHQGGSSAEDCAAQIQAALQDRWIELRRNLEYEKSDAEQILSGALAYYLDERFSITDGQKLGWLMGK